MAGMSSPPLVDFGHEDTSSFLNEHVDAIVTFRNKLSPEQKRRLMVLYSAMPLETENVYGADFDLAGEVNQQIIAVRAMRESIMEGGRIRQNTPTREVKEVIAASTTMLSSLMKFHREVINLDRMRAIEKATVKVLGNVEESLKTRFLVLLEKELETIE